MLRTFTLSTISFCLLASSLFGAEGNKTARRVESITWNPVDHKLVWTVSKGTVNSMGKFQASDQSTYEIDMDAALMTLSGEDRRFSKSEAVSVHALMDVVAKYAAESTVWWDAGNGEPLKEGEKDKIKRDHENAPSRPLPRRSPEPPPTKIIRIALEDDARLTR